jgi:signal transduction histidine kinase
MAAPDDRLEELRAALEAERRANSAKDELLGIVSHELRTPLNAILGWTEMLRSGTVKPENLPRVLETISRNARAQARMVEELLDTAHATQGRLYVTLAPVSARDVVHIAVHAEQASAEAKEITLTMALDAEGSVRADAARLKQVVQHLVRNAVEFTPKGGAIDVSLRETGGHVEIAVQDSGEGITADLLPHVFDRFRPTTRRHGGLGLGLALVRDIVTLHGGSVAAQSDGAGRGARFVVRLPVSA